MSPLNAKPAYDSPGAPMIPTGNPMLDGVGPAAWAERADEPDVTAHGVPKIVPMRLNPEFSIAKQDPDPRGLKVIAADAEVAGVITDVWVDRAEPQVRYYEVTLTGTERTVLLPVGFVQWPHYGLFHGDYVKVKSITAAQFKDVPAIKRNDRITRLEEDKIAGYYAGGYLYALPYRMGPAV